MKASEIEKRLRKALIAANKLPHDEGYFDLATEFNVLKEEGHLEWGVITGKEDHVTCIDVGLANGDTLEIEIKA